jgi:hypothetical protein
MKNNMDNLEQFLQLIEKFFSDQIGEEELESATSSFDNQEELWGYLLENL